MSYRRIKFFDDKLNKLVELILLAALTLFVLVFSLLYAFLWRVPSAVEVFDRATQSVVELKAETGDGVTSYGSAVLMDKDGCFFSNAHVVTYIRLAVLCEFEEYYIRFSFETEYRKVELISYDTEKDTAVLKLTKKPDFKLRPIKRGAVDKLKSGDTVYAVGNAMNHGISISQGIVGLPRINIEYDGKMRSAIQCDLTINEGNSGGALLDRRGRLIGITTFRIKDRLGNPIQGIAFCVPISEVF